MKATETQRIQQGHQPEKHSKQWVQNLTKYQGKPQQGLCGSDA